jgi:hypothetical protein
MAADTAKQEVDTPLQAKATTSEKSPRTQVEVAGRSGQQEPGVMPLAASPDSTVVAKDSKKPIHQ